MVRIRVFIVDDHEIARSGLRRLLELESDIELVGEAPDGNEALKKIEVANPDVVLMDIKMPGADGIATTRTLKEMCPNVKVVMLTVYTGIYVTAAIDAGADSYLLKDISSPELIGAIRSAARGVSTIHVLVPREQLPYLISENHHKDDRRGLSPRQLNILLDVAQGESNAAIARKSFLSERTVKRELHEIMEKLGVLSRVEAVAYAYEHQLI